jgi:zinc protease
MLRYSALCGAVLLGLFSLPAYAITVDIATMDGGVQVWVAEDTTLPLVTLVLTFEGAGTTTDAPGYLGRAAFTAAMLTEGAGSYDAQAFAEHLAEHAIDISASVNEDALTVRVQTLREHLPYAIELVSLALSNPQFAAADVARVKAQTLAQLQRAQESPTYRASRLLATTLYGTHPYANAALGTPEDVAGLQLADMRDYVGSYLTRGHISVAAAGDISADDLADALDPLLQALPENIVGPAASAPVSVANLGTSTRENMEVPQTVILFALPWVSRGDPSFYASYLVKEILGGSGLTSRLAEAVRQSDGQVYSVSADLDLLKSSSILVGYAATRNDQVDDVKQRIRDTITELRLKGATTEECADAKTFVIGSLPIQLDSTGAMASMLQMMQRFDLSEDYLETRAATFDAISCQDINEEARNLLDPEALVFAVVGGQKK